MTNDKGLQDARIKIGTKQTMRNVEQGQAEEVYIAQDAEQHLITKIVQLCEKHNVKVTYVETMKELGKACGIEVGSAMAVVLK
ncbi:ribosomal L7Ae/L30e/S12e/Gadd45 family protein [Paenibacillus hunanensis]|uniref:Large subunit ribosomal protein L7A n=1 Tax=Paenibacillus hunanensis TaxID=539262 RepID=A0ABU1J6K5_9BACL|nr:ribosomal L7Ae/L30e/S12e/Gadd45 family protein [Paenibacillus hunanensis]MCL9663261.1 ribosomal L7Ae/L30e/S12e/Gadd45 family protein [Paenibacillus hunanensis]MDR6246113.1 large subunit ribosomal protein L7A [Paenibacillus hunanensis]WPP40894.1 ribosomal L7Ae/L30e/S12e/Gadd45 family protein [Paenibacillus hunanensis]GGJ29160.1 ribosome-associated protein L7Ae-like [Paenibacillus hunanensis]